MVNLSKLDYADKWYLIDVAKWVEDPRVVIKLVLYNPMVDDYTIINADVNHERNFRYINDFISIINSTYSVNCECYN